MLKQTKIETKICTKCKGEKSIDEFYKDRKSKDGHTFCCKQCLSDISKEYYQSNKKKICGRNKKWREANFGYREKYIEKTKKYNQKYHQEHYENNAEKIKKRQRKYYQDNPEKINERNKKWQKDNRQHINEYKKERRKNNPIFRLNQDMSLAIGRSLKGNKKGRHWETLVNYTFDELKKHLESTMPEGYTWNDYLAGGLHIDHKIPKSIFNITSAKSRGFKACWALENLQFLPALENIRKADKLFV